ncbi:hypothetical protein ACJIZ3_003207 [Penstemon smallii]|uniref:Knottins-like domain-containing protein n=1 Tax=Penstemon smallii TaxID=265156 RepID=A0ABD3U8K6_9LAMI
MGRFSIVFLVLLLLLVTEIGPTVGIPKINPKWKWLGPVAGNICLKLSNKYQGYQGKCSSSYCANACKNEGGKGGICNSSRCYCIC